MVDAGGVYFQFVTVTALYLLYVVFPSPVLVASIFATYLAIIAAVNPFLKFDGYWILSDLLGIPSLARRSRETVNSLRKEIANGRGLQFFSREATGWKYGLAALVYCGLSGLFFVLLLIQVVFFMKISMRKAFCELESFVNDQRGYSFTEALSHAIDVVAAAIPVVLLAAFVFATGARVIRRHSGS